MPPMLDRVIPGMPFQSWHVDKLEELASQIG